MYKQNNNPSKHPRLTSETGVFCNANYDTVTILDVLLMVSTEKMFFFA